METTWDKLRAILYALSVHGCALLLMFVGLHCQQLPVPSDAEGPIIEATLMSSPQQSASAAKAIKAAERKAAQPAATPPPLQPKPEPVPQDAAQPPQPAPQARLPKPDTVDQEEVRRDADLAAQQKQLQEQEARRKQAQVDLTNQLQQQLEAQNRQRLAQQELERQKQLEDIRKQRADAERKVMLAEQRLKQLRDQRANLPNADAAVSSPAPAAAAHPPSGNNGAKQDPNGKYLQAIKDALDHNWRRTGVPEGVHCHVKFTQDRPFAIIKDVVFGDCQFDAAARETVEELKGIHLPYSGFEGDFKPEVNIDMCYPQEACTK